MLKENLEEQFKSRKATQSFECSECEELIETGEEYFEIIDISKSKIFRICFSCMVGFKYHNT